MPLGLHCVKWIPVIDSVNMFLKIVYAVYHPIYFFFFLWNLKKADVQNGCVKPRNYKYLNCVFYKSALCLNILNWKLFKKTASFEKK